MHRTLLLLRLIMPSWTWAPTSDFGVKEDWFDLVVGARFTKPISERWEMQLRGDPGYFEYDTVTHGPIIGVNFKS